MAAEGVKLTYPPAGCEPAGGIRRRLVLEDERAVAIKEIQAKVLLAHVRQPDPWFGLRYNMNLYRGCRHRCIYCDSRSECYQIEHFDREVLVKANAIELLQKELARKRVVGTIRHAHHAIPARRSAAVEPVLMNFASPGLRFLIRSCS